MKGILVIAATASSITGRGRPNRRAARHWDIIHQIPAGSFTTCNTLQDAAPQRCDRCPVGPGIVLAMLSAVLADLSGTLHVGGSALPGAAAALARLRQHPSLEVRFVTNTTKDTTSNLVRLLQAMDFDIQQHEVFSSLRAAKKLIQDQQLRALLLLHPDALPEFGGIDCCQPNAVVMGLAQQAFSYDSMNAAWAAGIGPGPYAAALEFATGRTAQVVGKPQPSFFQLALDDLQVPPEAAVMVGDDVCDDVGGAMACGMAGLLVQTGKYLPGDERSKGVQPTATVKDSAAAVDWILQKVGTSAD
ncbi:hypothetical protein OEZ85_004110 [Tetradesmus obliquus]|uniref:STAS domain-containing protein n=1 Tax=Tetradesmus obliquus TaxID=3088 RepID=A0ABY8UDQ3_TETOB|nr:hypothetical protein OEZ85_004110 [Tetradesmus obliquus]